MCMCALPKPETTDRKRAFIPTFRNSPNRPCRLRRSAAGRENTFRNKIPSQKYCAEPVRGDENISDKAVTFPGISTHLYEGYLCMKLNDSNLNSHRSSVPTGSPAKCAPPVARSLPILWSHFVGRQETPEVTAFSVCPVGADSFRVINLRKYTNSGKGENL